MILKHYLIVIITLFTMNTGAQILEKHQWKNRIVLVLSKSENTPKLAEQIEEFKIQNEAFKDRKLIVYNVLPNQYKLLNSENEAWNNSSELYKNYASKKQDFEVILIGLDGGVKLKQSEILSSKKLFATIDAMPMRRAEMREKNK